MFLLKTSPNATYLKILLYHIFYRSFTIHVDIHFPVLNTVIQILNQNTLMVEFVFHIVHCQIHRYFAERVCAFHNTVVMCNFHTPYVHDVKVAFWCLINHLTSGFIKAIICFTNSKKY